MVWGIFLSFSATAAGMAVVGLSGCSQSVAAEYVDYNSKTLDQIVEDAKKEGNVNSVGMPDTWANWIGTWSGIRDTYGISHEDLDMSSAEEIALFKEEGRDGTKDIGDMDNLEPAYDFWTTLAIEGRIDTGDTSTARIESGEIAVGLFWDYNALNYRDNAVANNPGASFTVNVPSDGSVQSGDSCGGSGETD